GRFVLASHSLGTAGRLGRAADGVQVSPRAAWAAHHVVAVVGAGGTLTDGTHSSAGVGARACGRSVRISPPRIGAVALAWLGCALLFRAERILRDRFSQR